MSRRRKPKPAQPAVLHGPDCLCSGKGVLPGKEFTAPNGVTYPKVSVRCPGAKAWTAPQADETAHPKKAAGQDAAAGEREEAS